MSAPAGAKNHELDLIQVYAPAAREPRWEMLQASLVGHTATIFPQRPLRINGDKSLRSPRRNVAKQQSVETELRLENGTGGSRETEQGRWRV